MSIPKMSKDFQRTLASMSDKDRLTWLLESANRWATWYEGRAIKATAEADSPTMPACKYRTSLRIKAGQFRNSARKYRNQADRYQKALDTTIVT